MTKIIRTTRICPWKELNPAVLRALRANFTERKLGDLVEETILCCETVTERKNTGRFSAFLDGSPDTIDRLGLILTEEWLFWARVGDRSGTVAMGGNLKDIRVRTYTAQSTRENSLDINGRIGEFRQRLHGKLALGPEPDAKKFCEQVEATCKKAHPPRKGFTIPWFKW